MVGSIVSLVQMLISVLCSFQRKGSSEDAPYLESIEVVDSQYCTSLVLIGKETEPL